MYLIFVISKLEAPRAKIFVADTFIPTAAPPAKFPISKSPTSRGSKEGTSLEGSPFTKIGFNPSIARFMHWARSLSFLEHTFRYGAGIKKY